MAVKAVKADSDLVIRFKTGVDGKGKDIIKGQKFSKLKMASTDEDVYTVADAIGALLVFPLQGVMRNDGNLLVRE